MNCVFLYLSGKETEAYVEGLHLELPINDTFNNFYLTQQQSNTISIDAHSFQLYISLNAKDNYLDLTRVNDTFFII